VNVFTHVGQKKLKSLCELMVKFNGTTYDNWDRNCQDFVNAALNLIAPVKWLKSGPIEKFVDQIKKVNCNNCVMTIWNFSGTKTSQFSGYWDFNCYCKENRETCDLLNKQRGFEPQLTAVEEEYLQVLKAVERGFIVQLPNDLKPDNQQLIFPVEELEETTFTALPGITTFSQI